MTALTASRNTPAQLGMLRSGPVGAAKTIYAGALLMRTATGYIVPGATATGCTGVGRAESSVDNSAGADGAVAVAYVPGTFLFANSAGADEITIADVGALAWIVDDQTVAKTDGGTTRSPAGIIEGIDATGVWVRCDEALTRAS